MTLNIPALREAATKATSFSTDVSKRYREAQADFHRAANPQVILELLSSIEADKGELERLTALNVRQRDEWSKALEMAEADCRKLGNICGQIAKIKRYPGPLLSPAEMLVNSMIDLAAALTPAGQQ